MMQIDSVLNLWAGSGESSSGKKTTSKGKKPIPGANQAAPLRGSSNVSVSKAVLPIPSPTLSPTPSPIPSSTLTRPCPAESAGPRVAHSPPEQQSRTEKSATLTSSTTTTTTWGVAHWSGGTGRHPSPLGRSLPTELSATRNSRNLDGGETDTCSSSPSDTSCTPPSVSNSVSFTANKPLRSRFQEGLGAASVDGIARMGNSSPRGRQLSPHRQRTRPEINKPMKDKEGGKGHIDSVEKEKEEGDEVAAVDTSKNLNDDRKSVPQSEGKKEGQKNGAAHNQMSVGGDGATESALPRGEMPKGGKTRKAGATTRRDMPAEGSGKGKELPTGRITHISTTGVGQRDNVDDGGEQAPAEPVKEKEISTEHVEKSGSTPKHKGEARHCGKQKPYSTHPKEGELGKRLVGGEIKNSSPEVKIKEGLIPKEKCRSNEHQSPLSPSSPSSPSPRSFYTSSSMGVKPSLENKKNLTEREKDSGKEKDDRAIPKSNSITQRDVSVISWAQWSGGGRAMAGGPLGGGGYRNARDQDSSAALGSNTYGADYDVQGIHSLPFQIQDLYAPPGTHSLFSEDQAQATKKGVFSKTIRRLSMTSTKNLAVGKKQPVGKIADLTHTIGKDPVLKEGLMSKKMGRFSKWRQRWCVLCQSGVLIYCRGKTAADSNSGNYQHNTTVSRISLHGAQVFRVEYHGQREKKDFAFGIKTEEKTHLFSVHTSEELENWILLMKTCVPSCFPEEEEEEEEEEKEEEVEEGEEDEESKVTQQGNRPDQGVADEEKVALKVSKEGEVSSPVSIQAVPFRTNSQLRQSPGKGRRKRSSNASAGSSSASTSPHTPSSSLLKRSVLKRVASDDSLSSNSRISQRDPISFSDDTILLPRGTIHEALASRESPSKWLSHLSSSGSGSPGRSKLRSGTIVIYEKDDLDLSLPDTASLKDRQREEQMEREASEEARMMSLSPIVEEMQRVYHHRIAHGEIVASDLEEAITQGDLLLEYGSANMFQRPLHLAVKANRVDLVKALIQAGADCHAKDRTGMSVLVRLCRDQSYSADSNNVYNTLSLSLYLFPSFSLSLILSFSHSLFLFLSFSLSFSNILLLLLLVQYSVVSFIFLINLILFYFNHVGCTPLHYCNSEDTLKLFLEMKNTLDFNIPNEDGSHAFSYIVQLRDLSDTSLLTLLDKFGADVHRKNSHLEAPLHFAATRSNETTIDILLSRRANPNVTNDRGETPLVYAIRAHRAVAASSLLAYGADPFIASESTFDLGEVLLEDGEELDEGDNDAPRKGGFSLLRGKPLQTLVALLKNENETYMKIFFLTYHSFMGDMELFSLLVSELKKECPADMQRAEFMATVLNPARITVMRIFTYWIRYRYYEFRFVFPTKLRKRIQKLIGSLCESIVDMLGREVRADDNMDDVLDAIIVTCAEDAEEGGPIPRQHPLRHDLKALSLRGGIKISDKVSILDTVKKFAESNDKFMKPVKKRSLFKSIAKLRNTEDDSRQSKRVSARPEYDIEIKKMANEEEVKVSEKADLSSSGDESDYSEDELISTGERKSKQRASGDGLQEGVDGLPLCSSNRSNTGSSITFVGEGVESKMEMRKEKVNEEVEEKHRSLSRKKSGKSEAREPKGKKERAKEPKKITDEKESDSSVHESRLNQSVSLNENLYSCSEETRLVESCYSQSPRQLSSTPPSATTSPQLKGSEAGQGAEEHCTSQIASPRSSTETSSENSSCNSNNGAKTAKLMNLSSLTIKSLADIKGEACAQGKSSLADSMEDTDGHSTERELHNSLLSHERSEEAGGGSASTVVVQDASVVMLAQSVKRLRDLLVRFELPDFSRSLIFCEKFAAGCSTPSLDPASQKPQIFARYITLFQFELLHTINPPELLDSNWNNDKQNCPNLKRYVDHFNLFSRWVAKTILNPSTPRERANVFSRWVSICSFCLGYQNYTAVFAILGGLLCSPVYRLRNTIPRVSKSTIEQFTVLKEKMDPRGSYAAYRKLLSDATPPCIPYLGLVLQDLTFIDDGNPDSLGKNKEMVNFSKRKQIYNAVAPILNCQNCAYKFIGDNVVGLAPLDTFSRASLPAESFFFFKLPTIWEKDLYDLSMEREPRESRPT